MVTFGQPGGHLGYREGLSVGFYLHSLPKSAMPHVCSRFRISESCVERRLKVLNTRGMCACIHAGLSLARPNHAVSMNVRSAACYARWFTHWARTHMSTLAHLWFILEGAVAPTSVTLGPCPSVLRGSLLSELPLPKLVGVGESGLCTEMVGLWRKSERSVHLSRGGVQLWAR